MGRSCGGTLPNALEMVLSFLPFILSRSVTVLTSLDFLGLSCRLDCRRWGTVFAVLVVFARVGVRGVFDLRKG